MPSALLPPPTPSAPASEDTLRLMAASDKRRRKLAQWLASLAGRRLPSTPRRVVRMANGDVRFLLGTPHVEWRKQFDGPQMEIPAPVEVS